MPTPNAITPNQPLRLIGTPNCPVLVDISIDPDFAPEAAGLLALSVGLSRQCRDNHPPLKAGMALYDSLYRWARDDVNKGRDWPEGRNA